MARQPLGSAYIYALLALTGYIVADLTILSYRDQLIPEKAPPPRVSRQTFSYVQPRDFYNTITSKNMFNLDGKIPPALGGDGRSAEPMTDDSPPVPTSISGLQLIGTLVHSNPDKSVASVKTPSGGEAVAAFRRGDNMPGAGEVLGIERGRVIFRNSMNRRKEFFELPQDGRINLGLAAPTTKAASRVDGEVQVISETERTIKRDDVTRLTSNLPDLLQQARAVKDGDCFRVLDMMPGSIYERLGIKRGDCIRSVNGEPVDSPQKAMELYNTLKNSNSISLGVERNGRPETLNFSIQ
ncbi:MAG: PDZ domain-containing protein [Bdellovibrionaceae bacterium]|nr:PDZ domain-containing protein [Pseudobdellovibrionaceae bacterium]